MQQRSVDRVVTAHRQLEGGGFPVRRPFPTPGLDQVDPFLLLDEMGPVEWRPGEAIGAPDHPHRGFETVTYVLAGKVHHEDSQGHAGVIGPGDVQWMTAGAGVVHSEEPEASFRREGGLMHGFQLWVNLPRSHKMIAPRYQEIPKERIPEATSDDGLVTVRVIAGRSMEREAVIDTHVPITYLHFTVRPGGRHAQPVDRAQAGFAYVFAGAGEIAGREVREGQMAMLAPDGDELVLAAPPEASQPMELLLITGEPLREPVVRYGPFVMNSKSEILEAVRDFSEGRLGAIRR